MSIAKDCAKHFLAGIQFYSQYNFDKRISMVGFDVEPDCSGIYLALHFEKSKEHIELGTADWNESTIAKFDISYDRTYNKLSRNNADSLEEYLVNILKETVVEITQKFKNINCNTKVLFGYNFHDEGFCVINEFEINNTFQKDDTIVLRGLEIAAKDENSAEYQVLSNMDITTAPKRALADIESIFYNKPNFSFYKILIEHYHSLGNKELILLLLNYVIKNTDFNKAVLWDRTTLRIIEQNNINDSFIVKEMQKAFETTNLDLIANTIIKITGDDPKKYFRTCPKCNNKLKTKKALQCEACLYKWHKCPNCGEPWVRDTSVCSKCSFNLYIEII